jgi:hypothetical protein
MQGQPTITTSINARPLPHTHIATGTYIPANPAKPHAPTETSKWQGRCVSMLLVAVDCKLAVH